MEGGEFVGKSRRNVSSLRRLLYTVCIRFRFSASPRPQPIQGIEGDLPRPTNFEVQVCALVGRGAAHVADDLAARHAFAFHDRGILEGCIHL